MSEFREETDSMGKVLVPASCYFGAQTMRSLHHFSIGHDTLPCVMIEALALIKKAAAIVNCDLKKLSAEKKEAIIAACDKVITGGMNDQFPVRIFATGSGTQSNMNMNEVIANLVSQAAGKPLGSKEPVHPNDHVNMSQSSNDAYPTAMHIAAVLSIHRHLIPSLEKMKGVLEKKMQEFEGIIKIGRTHLMDAVPLTLSQEFSAFVAQLDQTLERIVKSLDELYALALGGTAVGTGINTHPEFAVRAAQTLGALTGMPFVSAPNKFSYLAAHDPLVFFSGILRTLGGTLLKLATDISWMGSGPRTGLFEMLLPANEPGSSIMPGKVNPTQCEALSMVAVQVMGLDTAVAVAGSRGNFQLNVYKPLIIFNILKSIELLSDGMNSFTQFLLEGLKPNQKKLSENVERSLMLVTILNQTIGYDNAARIAKLAYQENITLKQACMQLGLMSEQDFDRAVNVEKMVHP